MLVIAVSVDGFAAAVTMGGNGIHIPVRSTAILSLTGTLFLGVSIVFADGIGSLLPPIVFKIISAAALVSIGLYNILKSRLKKKYEPEISDSNPSIVFLDEVKSDKDHNKILSAKEAALLSVALSADSLATGAASASITAGHFVLTLFATFFTGVVFVIIGSLIGKRMSTVCHFDFGIIGGAILIMLAAMNFI
jgi:putative sporulation protein YtaF